MFKDFQQEANRWARFVNIIDAIIAVTLIIIGIGGFFVIQDKFAFIGLVVSISIAYITTLRPNLRKARLKMFIDDTRCSPPTLPNDTASWFIRLGIINCGLSSANECVGRIVSVWTEHGERLEKFDPLTLYWARQDKDHTGFKPVTIQGYGDIEYLDIAQIKKDGTNPPLLLRTAFELSLVKGKDDSPSPGSAPWLHAGIYYIQVAVYADNANIPPRCFEIVCSENIPECGGDEPYSIQEMRPKFLR
jgi:hypothetical protein